MNIELDNYSKQFLEFAFCDKSDAENKMEFFKGMVCHKLKVSDWDLGGTNQARC